MTPPTDDLHEELSAEWQRRVIGRSLKTAAERSVDRGRSLIDAAMAVLERSNGDDITVQEVADEAGQSLRTLYQYFGSKDDLLLAVFEESMRTYAQLIERAIADLTDPFDRLAGAIVAAARMPDLTQSSVQRGVSRVRLRLSEVEPERLGRAQVAMTDLMRGLVEGAVASGRIHVADPDAATFMILSLNATFITAATIGNDAGVRRPDVEGATAFSLRGLGAELDEHWYRDLEPRLELPSRPARAPKPKPAAKKRAK